MSTHKTNEQKIEHDLIEKLKALKYTYRDDIKDRDALERNFREKFEALNKVRLTDAEFARLLDEIVSPDVFACSERLRHINTFEYIRLPHVCNYRLSLLKQKEKHFKEQLDRRACILPEMIPPLLICMERYYG